MDREAWRATVCGGHKELDMTEATYHACILLVFAMELNEFVTFPMKFSRQIAKLNEEY